MMYMMLLTSLLFAKDDIDDMKRNIKALELFVQDREDKKEYCPKLKWIQPHLKVYKKELKSQLPEKCKVPKKK